MLNHMHIRPKEFAYKFPIYDSSLVAYQGTVQTGHSVYIAGDEANIMGNYYYGHTLVQLFQQIENIRLNPHVDIGRGFIENQ